MNGALHRADVADTPKHEPTLCELARYSGSSGCPLGGVRKVQSL